MGQEERDHPGTGAGPSASPHKPQSGDPVGTAWRTIVQARTRIQQSRARVDHSAVTLQRSSQWTELLRDLALRQGQTPQALRDGEHRV